MPQGAQGHPLPVASLRRPEGRGRGPLGAGAGSFRSGPPTFVALGLILVGLSADRAGGQQVDDIFAINADGTRAASGFKVEDTRGRPRIVTALHVAAGAGSVSASNAK